MAPAPTSSKGAAKGSKKAVESINAKLQLVMKSGKVALGLKTVTKSLRHNKAKMVIISSNTPALRKSEIEVRLLVCARRRIFSVTHLPFPPFHERNSTTPCLPSARCTTTLATTLSLARLAASISASVCSPSPMPAIPTFSRASN